LPPSRRTARRPFERAGMMRILVVEDNPDLAYGLRNNLEIEGYQVEVADDGTKGLARARDGRPDLIILDLMLPGMDGFRVLRALREAGRTMPVLILTARGEEADKVRGLRLGADDYVTKPFGVLELLARIEALLRAAAEPRKDGGPPPPPFEQFGEIEVLPPSPPGLRDGPPGARRPGGAERAANPPCRISGRAAELGHQCEGHVGGRIHTQKRRTAHWAAALRGDAVAKCLRAHHPADPIGSRPSGRGALRCEQ